MRSDGPNAGGCLVMLAVSLAIWSVIILTVYHFFTTSH